MKIAAYLDRIGYKEDTAPTLETLTAIHQAHLRAIPYENFDIHLGRYLLLDDRATYEKIVMQRRGGWCYEMNGLMAWALRELGFSVTLLASAVNRTKLGAAADFNHLILKVYLDRAYIVDVGFGNGIFQPLPLEPGVYVQHGFAYGLSYDDDTERWNFFNQPYGGVMVEFTLRPRQITDFSARCHELQTSPSSSFVRNVVAYRFTPTGYIGLRNATLTTVKPSGELTRTIESEGAFRRVLSELFDLNLSSDQLSTLWQVVWQKHQT